ncbi:MAG: hypothetical protein H7Y36_08895 [Armatimonadetes bacterium]|nr:hypothetical protein [Akkermansiaceae bacterium]
MKLSTILVQAAFLGALASSLHAKDPVLTTPGTATWTTETTATGTRTVFTLSKNTVFDWEQLNLKSGSELVFNFTDGKTVVNFLGGTGTHVIDGAVTSNGIVAFFSPSADLEVNGSIIAKGVTLSTLKSDAADFSDGNGYKMTGPGGFNYLTVNGRVEATDGDVVLGGERVIVGDTARIKSSQDVLIGGGRDISVAGSGERRLKEESGFGFVLHLGETRASRIEVAAGREISNQGSLNSGNGRIFLEVGEGGLITNESSGVIVGNAVFNGEYDSDGVILVPDEGDAVPAVNEATLTIPKLTRPDGTKVSTAPQTIRYSVPMSASGDAGRDSSHSERADKRVAQNSSSKSLLQRSSFFGMRGGNTAVAKR